MILFPPTCLSFKPKSLNTLNPHQTLLSAQGERLSATAIIRKRETGPSQSRNGSLTGEKKRLHMVHYYIFISSKMLRKVFIAWEGVADEFLTEIMCTGASSSACCLNKYLETTVQGPCRARGKQVLIQNHHLSALLCVFCVAFFALMETVYVALVNWMQQHFWILYFIKLSFEQSCFPTETRDFCPVLFPSPSAPCLLWCHEEQLRNIVSWHGTFIIKKP